MWAKQDAQAMISASVAEAERAKQRVLQSLASAVQNARATGVALVTKAEQTVCTYTTWFKQN